MKDGVTFVSPVYALLQGRYLGYRGWRLCLEGSAAMVNRVLAIVCGFFAVSMAIAGFKESDRTGLYLFGGLFLVFALAARYMWKIADKNLEKEVRSDQERRQRRRIEAPVESVLKDKIASLENDIRTIREELHHLRMESRR